jgi:hypothetical protein
MGAVHCHLESSWCIFWPLNWKELWRVGYANFTSNWSLQR